jgi:transposase
MKSSTGYKYVLMDNISFHHSKEIKELAKQHKMKLLYPPPYSPDFNPIELAFSQLKRIFRNKLYENVPFKTAVKDSLLELKKTYPSFVADFRHSLPHI